MKNKKLNNISEIIPLYVVIFLGFFGFALTVALYIPMLMDTNFAILPEASPTSLRVSISGFLLAMYPLGQFLGSPVIGKLSDHYGRKKVLMISLVACVIGFISIALSIQFHLLTLLFASSFLTGLCESNMAISQSIIAERSNNIIQKTKLIGYAFSACSLGYIMGPLVGGFGATLYSYSFPFWVTAAGILLLLVWVKLSFKDHSHPHHEIKIKWVEAITAMKTIFNQPALRKFYLVNFLIFFAVQGLYRVAPIYVIDKWQPDLNIYTLLIAFVSALCFFANLFLMGKLSKKFSTEPLLIGLLIFSGIFIISIIIPNNFNWIWLTYGLAVIPTVMALTACTTWLSNQIDIKSQGQVLGNNQALLVLGEATSAIFGGIIAAINISLPLVVMGTILLISSFLVWQVMHKSKKDTDLAIS
ncbi:MFS transporter [Thiotrichales bacterium 19S9-12]|nr:MFS transporter [Thiotrichales bacterium 19S9-11]MCF6811904.1 MFS transporter [Thiotrichales bacterium 19S9-12]